jgi:hypothetical protein
LPPPCDAYCTAIHGELQQHVVHVQQLQLSAAASPERKSHAMPHSWSPSWLRPTAVKLVPGGCVPARWSSCPAVASPHSRCSLPEKPVRSKARVGGPLGGARVLQSSLAPRAAELACPAAGGPRTSKLAHGHGSNSPQAPPSATASPRP